MCRFKTDRLSSVELLRIVAILLIMYGHTHLRINQLPELEAIDMQPFLAYLDVMSSCIVTTGVGIFVAISGWFGIRFKSIGLAKYLFMVVFNLWTVYGLAIAFHLTTFDETGVKYSLTFYDGYWFVIGYLGLYLISPILNSFIEHTSRKEYQIVLLSYYLFLSYYSWTCAWYDYYNGYSIILFAGIYLTAAYLKKYPVEWINRYALILFALTILTTTSIAYFSLWKFGHAARQIRDDNPLVILASIILLISFGKLKYQSRIINWMATSCFSVYLIHYSPFVYPYIMQFMRSIYVQFDGLLYAALLIISLLTIYLACTLFDQVRILVWKAVLLLTKTKR